jgi:hypothetical protein
MEYIEIKDGIIIGHYDALKVPKGNQYKAVDIFNGYKGMKAAMIDDRGSVRPISDLIADGLVKDCRGKYWDKTTKQYHEISEYDQEPDPNWTDKQPSGMPYEYWNGDDWTENPDEKAKYELNIIRMKRSSEFAQFDKYQLPLPWGDLTESQKSEYTAWRSAWLDAPTTGIEPERPEWFI